MRDPIPKLPDQVQLQSNTRLPCSTRTVSKDLHQTLSRCLSKNGAIVILVKSCPKTKAQKVMEKKRRTVVIRVIGSWRKAKTSSGTFDPIFETWVSPASPAKMLLS